MSSSPHKPSGRYFIGKIEVEQRPGGWWVLEHGLTYVDLAGPTITVPAGFITDFASIPRVFWNLAAPTDYEYASAAVVHDRLYETHQLTRRESDGVFFDAMVVYGTPNWKRWAMWAAVRLFGGAAYRSGPERRQKRRRVDWYRRTI